MNNLVQCSKFCPQGGLNVAIWPLPSTDPTALRFPNSVTTVPTVRSGVQRPVTELFKNAGAPLSNLFLAVVMTGISSGPSSVGK